MFLPRCKFRQKGIVIFIVDNFFGSILPIFFLDLVFH
jgi:hypothetical protein